MDWQKKYRHKLISPEEAAGLVKSGDRVVLALSLKPREVALAIARRASELRNVTIVSHWNEDYPWLHPGMEDSFYVKEGFVLRPSRQPVREKRVDWMPTIFGLHDGQRQALSGRSPVYHFADLFLVRLTPPSPQGYCSFGHALWYSPTALRTAKIAIAQIDPSLPYTLGESVSGEDIDYLVAPGPAPEATTPPLPMPGPEEWERAQVIGALASDLVKDGDTIQIGIGTPSEAVMEFLGTKNDLGVYSELVFPRLIDLMREGVITGRKRSVDPGKVTTSCLWLYAEDPRAQPSLEFLDHNPAFDFRDISHICHIPRIAANENMTTINTALAIDLLGQAVIDHLGPVPMAGPGGQVEFCIGSHYSRGGRSITCLASTTQDGRTSRIVPQLEAGSVVQVPLTYIDFLATEHGVVNLDGKTRRERAEAIISVAHPDFQPELRRWARQLFYP